MLLQLQHGHRTGIQVGQLRQPGLRLRVLLRILLGVQLHTGLHTGILLGIHQLAGTQQ